MDTTLAAGWIAFWGAVGGAVLGAGFGGVISWLALRWQWTRQQRAQRLEWLDVAVSELHTDLRVLADEMAEERAPEDLLRAVRTRAGVVIARARVDHPHLADVVEEGMGRIEKEYVPLRPTSPDDVRDVSRVVARVTATFASPHVTVLADFLTHWLRDPADFERDRPALPARDSVKRAE